MPRPEPDQTLMPSLLDRLIDPASAGTADRSGYTMTQMVDAVRRDLEELLNTRQTHQGMPETFVELHRSIATYGLPDFASLRERQSQKQAIGRIIERIVAQFEPRLRDVRAVLHDEDADERESRVRYHIEARLSVDPCPEVSFVTVVEVLTGQATVEREAE